MQIQKTNSAFAAGFTEKRCKNESKLYQFEYHADRLACQSWWDNILSSIMYQTGHTKELIQHVCSEIDTRLFSLHSTKYQTTTVTSSYCI